MTDSPETPAPAEYARPDQSYAEPAAPAWPSPPAAEQKSPKLGRVAMVMAICVLALSLATSILLGLFATTIYHYSTSTGVGFTMQPNQGWFAAQALLGSVFGIWALTQGIVAAAQNRGRRFGVVAIVLAGAAPLLSLLVWAGLGMAFGHHVQM